MQIVSDRGLNLAAQQLAGLDNLHYVPLRLSLNGQTYRSGEDIQVDEFYRLLSTARGFPTTAQPTVDDFVTIYRRLAAFDSEILSIHISSGLSDTVHVAREAASLVPEANITVIDTHTLSVAQGWQVEAAARAAKLGWPLAQIMETLTRLDAAANTLFTLDDLRYLAHGGRVNHLQGVIAAALQIKPVISVDKVNGVYTQRGQARNFTNAVKAIAEVLLHQYPEGTQLRIQAVHGDNAEGIALLREAVARRFDCRWLPDERLAPILGAHTGPTLVGIAYAPAVVFEGLPW